MFVKLIWVVASLEGADTGVRCAQGPDRPDGPSQAPTEGEDGAGHQRVAEVGQSHQHGRQRCADDPRQSDQHDKAPGPAHQQGQVHSERDPQGSRRAMQRVGVPPTDGAHAPGHPGDLNDEDPQDNPVDHPQRCARR